MVIQCKLLHTYNYTLYAVYNMQKFTFPIRYGDLFIQNQYLSKTYQDIGNQLYRK
jgi:hypothetical protein